jgi:hypothetical protein
MLIANPGQQITIPFVFKSGYDYVDPDEDIYVYLRRGSGTIGSIIIGPLKFNITTAIAATPGTSQTLDSNTVLERVSTGSYELRMSLPVNLFEGEYTVQISSIAGGLTEVKEYYLKCKITTNQLNEVYSDNNKSIVINSKSNYKSINNGTTNNILLIGHTNAMQQYAITKISSIQDAVNKLNADINSPLLKGVFDAYSCGARDIYIMSAGNMGEYIEDVARRNTKLFATDSVTPNTYSFYELYYQRLISCYSLLERYEFIDIIVPLETSMVSTGNVNFVKQLSDHCQKMQEDTGEVQIGVIGSRSLQSTEDDIDELVSADFELESDVSAGGYITKDAGKYMCLIYGETIFNHKQLQRSYRASAAAAFAGTLSSTRVDHGLARKRLQSALSIVGANLTSAQLKSLTDNKINAIVGGQRSRRNVPYDIYISGDLTQSISENYSDASNVRLVAMIIAEIQSLGTNAIGKMGYDKVIRDVDAMLLTLKTGDIIRDYTFDAYADRLIRGKLYFNISIISVRTLRTISFNVSTGRGS